jgi:hypothetical protein
VSAENFDFPRFGNGDESHLRHHRLVLKPSPDFQRVVHGDMGSDVYVRGVRHRVRAVSPSMDAGDAAVEQAALVAALRAFEVADTTDWWAVERFRSSLNDRAAFRRRRSVAVLIVGALVVIALLVLVPGGHWTAVLAGCVGAVAGCLLTMTSDPVAAQLEQILTVDNENLRTQATGARRPRRSRGTGQGPSTAPFDREHPLAVHR